MMKKYLILFSLFFIAFSTFSQKNQKTIGLLLAPNVFKDSWHKELNFSYSTGIFYDHLFTHRFGLNTGIRFERTGGEEDYTGVIIRDAAKWPEKVVFRQYFLELPVNLAFCFNPEAKSGNKAFLYSGILLNRLVATKTTLYYKDETEVVRSKEYQNDLWADSYMNLGLEVRKNLSTKYSAAIGTSAQFRPAHSLDFQADQRDSILYLLNLKFGRNL